MVNETTDERVPDPPLESESTIENSLHHEPKLPRNRVFGYIRVDGTLDYSTVRSNPSKAYRAAKRASLIGSGAVLWEFVMTRQVKRDDVSTIVRNLLRNP